MAKTAAALVRVAIMCRCTGSSVPAERLCAAGAQESHVRTDIKDVYGNARSCRVVGMIAAGGAATAVPTSAPGDARYQQHHDDADIVDYGSSRLCGPHEPGNQPTSGLDFELRSTHNHYQQRDDAVRRLARAPGKSSQ